MRAQEGTELTLNRWKLLTSYAFENLSNIYAVVYELPVLYFVFLS